MSLLGDMVERTFSYCFEGCLNPGNNHLKMYLLLKIVIFHCHARFRGCILVIYIYISGQIIPTSAEVTPNGGLVRESPQNPLNSGLGIIVICPDI